MTENKKGCVLGTRKCDPVGFAQVAHCVTAHGHHGVGELAAMIGMQRSALTRKTDGHVEDLTVRQMLAIGELQRDHRMVEEVCRRAGGVYVPLDQRDIADADIHQSFLQAVRELGEDSAAIQHALADGVVTDDEAAQVAREIDQTVAALCAVKARVMAKANSRPSLVRTVAR